MLAPAAMGLQQRERHDLAGLLRIYESNYFRLLRLAPDLSNLQGTSVSSVAGALDLYLSVLERSRYTTTLLLTYHFDEEERATAEPNARICVYHDVRAAEVLSHCRRRRSRRALSWRPGHMPELERRWQMNRFLHKWLGFCHHQGHLFLRCTTRTLD